MRYLAAIFLILGFLAFGGYYLYQDPRVAELFEPIPPAGKYRVPSPRAAEIQAPKREAPQRQVKSKPEPPAANATGQVQGAVAETAELQNRTENQVVSRVLLQILFARKLAGGISLMVTDDSIEVAGEVDSAEKRRSILEIIDKGREARRIDAEHLLVRGVRSPESKH